MRTSRQVLALMGVATLLVAAAPSSVSSPVERQWRTARLGARLLVPEGVALRSEEADPSARPGVVLEQVRLLHGGDLLVTVDLWPDPLRLGAAGAMADLLGWLLDGRSRVSLLNAGRRRMPAFLLSQPRSPQSYGRRLLLVGSGGVLARITCEDTADARALAAFELAAASFDGPTSAGAP